MDCAINAYLIELLTDFLNARDALVSYAYAVIAILCIICVSLLVEIINKFHPYYIHTM